MRSSKRRLRLGGCLGALGFVGMCSLNTLDPVGLAVFFGSAGLTALGVAVMGREAWL